MNSLYLVCALLLINNCYAGFNPFLALNERPENYELPSLGYEITELQPYIDAKTVDAHYYGHHDTYRKKLNAALKYMEESGMSDLWTTVPILDLLTKLNDVPEDIRTSIRNNGGGYLNHCIYWACLAPNTDGLNRKPSGQLLEDIEKTFGKLYGLKAEFTGKAGTLFGSGYAWLSRDKDDKLVITTTTNQDSPLSEGLRPILVIDVWEHAYYLQHQFRRATYITQWFKLVDWDAVEAMDNWWRDKKATRKEEL